MPGQLGVFLAYPGIGKSWMALYFAVQAWKQGKSPLIISLEMSETEVRNRIFAIMGEGLWSHRKLSNGEVEIDMLKKWHSDKVAGRPEFHIISNDSGGEVTPSVIRGKIDQYRPDFVVVDYLQLMSPNQKADSETVRMKNLSRELKLMSIGEEVPIIAISSATPDDVKIYQVLQHLDKPLGLDRLLMMLTGLWLLVVQLIVILLNVYLERIVMGLWETS